MTLVLSNKAVYLLVVTNYELVCHLQGNWWTDFYGPSNTEPKV